MALFKGRSSLLEVQNRALTKTTKERAMQIDQLERELQALRERIERQVQEIERLTLERNFYCKRGLALEGENRELTEVATQYSLRAQKLERELTATAIRAQNQQRELTEVATQYSLRAQNVERELTEVANQYSLRAQKLERELTETTIRAQNLVRELTETATKYSLWGQKLERELARIDPDGAPARRFEAEHDA
jgi:chromosome segregation ATPase